MDDEDRAKWRQRLFKSLDAVRNEISPDDHMCFWHPADAEHDYVVRAEQMRAVHGMPLDAEVMARASAWLASWHRSTAMLQLGALSKRCESPLEQAMLVALATALVEACGGIELSDTTRVVFGADPLFSKPCRIVPQKQIGQYRVDFLVQYTPDFYSYGDPEPTFKEFNVVVECDGHDYHERTKEQAKRDKRRDRLLQELGYPVLRFTGSEIWEDAMGCARQVTRFLRQAERRFEAEL